MSQIKKGKIIVLRCIKHSEADLLVHALDSEGNRRHYLAKSALKSKKRFGGGLLQPTHYLEILYKEHGSQNEGDPLLILLEAKMIKDFKGLREHFDRLELGLFFLKIISKLTNTGAVGEKDIFDLLGNALSAAETCKSTENLKLQFQAKLLYSQGILPEDKEFTQLVAIPLSRTDSVQVRPEDRPLLGKRLEFETSQLLGLA